MEFVLALLLALAFAITNGFHDSANAIATLVATRAARPGPAVAMAAGFTVLGALLLGTKVADAVASVVQVSGDEAIQVVGSALAAAVAWNLLTWWWGLPSSSGHALVGGLVGAALGGVGGDAVRWGGVEDGAPVGALGVLIALAVAPIAGFALGLLVDRGLRAALTRADRRLSRPLGRGQWVASAALAFGHGTNDAQKSMGVIAVLLLADGRTETLTVPLWVKLASGAALTLGTALGGWRVVRTIGRRIVRLRPIDGLSTQTSAGAVLLAAAPIGAPVSTTNVVTSAVVGAGGARGRWHHVRWSLVGSIGAAWLVTLPATAALGAVVAVLWGAA